MDVHNHRRIAYDDVVVVALDDAERNTEDTASDDLSDTSIRAKGRGVRGNHPSHSPHAYRAYHSTGWNDSTEELARMWLDRSTRLLSDRWESFNALDRLNTAIFFICVVIGSITSAIGFINVSLSKSVASGGSCFVITGSSVTGDGGYPIVSVYSPNNALNLCMLIVVAVMNLLFAIASAASGYYKLATRIETERIALAKLSKLVRYIEAVIYCNLSERPLTDVFFDLVSCKYCRLQTSGEAVREYMNRSSGALGSLPTPTVHDLPNTGETSKKPRSYNSHNRAQHHDGINTNHVPAANRFQRGSSATLDTETLSFHDDLTESPNLLTLEDVDEFSNNSKKITTKHDTRHDNHTSQLVQQPTQQTEEESINQYKTKHHMAATDTRNASNPPPSADGERSTSSTSWVGSVYSKHSYEKSWASTRSRSRTTTPEDAENAS